MRTISHTCKTLTGSSCLSTDCQLLSLRMPPVHSRAMQLMWQRHNVGVAHHIMDCFDVAWCPLWMLYYALTSSSSLAAG